MNDAVSPTGLEPTALTAGADARSLAAELVVEKSARVKLSADHSGEVEVMKGDANKTPAQTRQARQRANGSGRLAVTLTGDQRALVADTEYGKEFHPDPVRINPESKEKREKRLAARKARTLRAFQMAYEDHRRR